MPSSAVGTKCEVGDLHDWLFKNAGRRKRLIDWLGLDARIDSGIATAWEQAKDRYNAFSTFFARFRLTGWKRGVNELVSEALTLGVGGLAVLYVLAIPALNDFDENKIATGKYAVKFIDRNGTEIGQRGILHNDAIQLEEIPDHLIKATLATEDRRFFEHFGVDVFGTARALFENARANDVVQGGSTITQQLAKNLFLSFERSLARKIKEAFLAILLEFRFIEVRDPQDVSRSRLSRRRRVRGGGGVAVLFRQVGARHQSGRGRTARRAVQGAHALCPARQSAGLARTHQRGADQPGGGRLHERRPGACRPPQPRPHRRAAPVAEPRLVPGLGVRGGPAHRRGQGPVRSHRPRDDRPRHAARGAGGDGDDVALHPDAARRAVLGRLVSMDPDGAVRAVVGGIDYGESQFNRATHARRQPGSSFKIYVYATALENGYNPRSIVRDASTSCGNWSPRNYNGGGGSGRALTVTDAFKLSLNTTAADLSFKVGRDKVLEMTKRLGVTGVRRTCSMALGDTGITLLEHTSAYAVFANGGKLSRPYAVLELFNSKGELVYSRERDEPPAPQIVSTRVVEQMNQMMLAVVQEGTGRRAILDFTHAVGKTGTSSSWRDAWFVGFTGALVTGVWVGHDDFRPMWLNGQGVTGGSLPATAWHAFMSVAHTNRNIPPIQGLPPHPVQVAEQARIAELKRTDPSLAQAQIAQASQKRSTIMPDQTRETLKRLADSMLRASGAQATPVSAPAPGGWASTGVTTCGA